MRGLAWLADLRAVPVDPDAEEARRWLLRELSGPEYRAAQPSWFELLVKAIRDWFDSLQFLAANDASLLVSTLIIAAIVLGVVVVVFLVFGLPRLNRRSALGGMLFGEADERDAAALRGAATRAAAAGDFSTAIAETFRAIARGLAERGVITTTPGTTATHFAEQAASLFPANAPALERAAATFDGVRYLGEAGAEEGYAEVAALEKQLRVARPARDEVPA